MPRRRAAAGLTLLAAAAGAGVLVVSSGGKEAAVHERNAAVPQGYVDGRVVDADGQPVAGATVTVAGSPVAVGSDGTFQVRVKRGVVVAGAPGYVSARRTVAQGSRVDLPLWKLGATKPPGPNSADRIILWTGCNELVTVSDDQLDQWKQRGVRGFVCQSGMLDAPKLPALERRIKAAPIGRRRDFDLYLGFYSTSPTNNRAPFADWFDDTAWRKRVLPAVNDLAAAARRLHFKGVAIDQELYDTRGATWSWRYPGNTRAEAATRAQVARRGEQLGQTIQKALPGASIVAYDTQLTGSWEELAQAKVNNVANAFGSDVQIDFWSGIAAARGYRAIYLLDAAFYKTPLVPGASWDEAARYNARAASATLSRHVGDWAYAADRVQVSPFAWVDAGPSDYERARTPVEVAAQLQAFRRWGAGRTFGNYAYGSLRRFDYAPYDDAFKAATTPGDVDTQPPVLNAAATGLRGTAGDDSAVRVVRWRDERGDESIARLTPDTSSADASAVDWTIAGSPRGHVWVRVEDIKGLATTAQVR
jgi:hypothetical protein